MTASNSAHASPDAATGRAGVIYAVAAYGFWGLVPIYFKAVSVAPALEVLAHRVVWSVAFLLLITFVREQWVALAMAARDLRIVRRLAVTTTLIALNWLTFIYSVKHGHVMQASLGYFINPLVTMLLGYVFLHERLSRWQTGSVVLAAGGVAWMTFAVGEMPSLALVMAFTFGFYGLLRKMTTVGTLTGLTIETTLIAPLAVGYLAWATHGGEITFGTGGTGITLLLIAAGLITAIPLLWFAAAARRLSLATLGFLQYLAPTGHFFCALYYGERLDTARLAAFVCIWVALGVYSYDAARRARIRRRGDLATVTMD